MMEKQNQILEQQIVLEKKERKIMRREFGH